MPPKIWHANLSNFNVKINYLCDIINMLMHILVTNDDDYTAPGLQVLVEILRGFGDVTVVAPKFQQSAMSIAVTMGGRPIAVKKLMDTKGERWWYADATPASCIKFALNEIFIDRKPDLVVAGINHGSNTGSATIYSATLGAAEEGALAGIPSFGISMDDHDRNADLSAVREFLPGILKKLLKHRRRKFGLYYNINFPNAGKKDIRGIRICHQGINHWEREFTTYDTGLPVKPVLEEGEKAYMIVGDLADNDNNIEPADHHYVACGYITIVALKTDRTDYEETGRLRDLEFDCNFR